MNITYGRKWREAKKPLDESEIMKYIHTNKKLLKQLRGASLIPWAKSSLEIFQGIAQAISGSSSSY